MGRRHVQAYLRNRRVSIGACCDQRPEALRFLDSLNIPCRRYFDWREMLREESLDILSIVTHGPSHAEITIEAAAAKIPKVICEKPMATSIKAALGMIEASKRNGTKLAINYSRRWSYDYRRLKKLIAEGVIGKLCEIYCVCGGGQLACNGSHFFDLMRFLSDSEATSIVGYIDKRARPNPRGAEFTDPGGIGIITFQDGMRGFVDMYEDLGVPPRVEIVGSIGRIVIDESKGSWLIEARRGKDRTQPVDKYGLPLRSRNHPAKPLDPVKLVGQTIQELLMNREIACSGYDGLAALEMIMGVHTSDLEGNIPVSLPIPSKYHSMTINFT